VRRLILVLSVTIALCGAGAIYWIAQDRTRCLLVPDFLQVILCDHELIASLSFKKGQFQGPLDVRFMSVQSGDGYLIEMVQLLKPFSYRDSNGVLWDVPEGFLSDGASIPEPLWLALGGPYSGPYRDAAVVHDYYCYTRNRKWADVHNVFFEASLNRGTPEWKAKYLYAGILLRGPRWPDPRSAIDRGKLVYAQTTPSPLPKSATPAAPPPTAAGKTDQEIFEDLRVWIEKEKPTRDQIRKRVEELRGLQTPIRK
jgi:hypothetical protein